MKNKVNEKLIYLDSAINMIYRILDDQFDINEKQQNFNERIVDFVLSKDCLTALKSVNKKLDTESIIKDPKLFGRFIKILRKDDGRSQRKLAILSGVNDSTISDLEIGLRKTIRKSTLAKIAHSLRITPKQLLSCNLNITRSMPW